jgi:hypothetical protein
MYVHKSVEHPTEPDGELRREQTSKLPSDVAQLEEANLPRDLATAVAGKAEPVELLWEKALDVRRAEPWDINMLIDREGKCWSEHSSTLAWGVDPESKEWRAVRSWLRPARSST